jgi:hypothetical protein
VAAIALASRGVQVTTLDLQTAQKRGNCSFGGRGACKDMLQANSFSYLHSMCDVPKTGMCDLNKHIR